MEFGGCSDEVLDQLGEIACDHDHASRAEAFDALFHCLKGWTARMASRRGALPSEVDDVVADAWVRLWRLGHFSKAKAGKGGFRSYLGRIVANVTLDTIERRRPVVLVTDVQPTTPSPVDDVLVAIQEAFDRLASTHPQWAETLRLLLVEDLSHEKIASTMGVAVETVGSRASRARTYITEALVERAYTSKPPAEERGYVLVHGRDAQATARRHGFERARAFLDAELLSFSPLGGHFVLPTTVTPDQATLVCEASDLGLWQYDLGRFLVTADGGLAAVVFEWKGWRVRLRPADQLRREGR